MRGFIQSDFAALFPQFEADMRQWLLAGQIRYRETIVQGLEQAPQALADVLDGKNFGKLVVKLD